MSDSPPLSLLDFNVPRRPSNEASRLLSTWHGHLCAQIQESWATLLSHQVVLQPGVSEPMQHHTALGRLPEDGLGVFCTLGEALHPSLFVFSSRQVQALVADLLDLSGEAWPEAKTLSAAEDAMLELLFQMLADSVSHAWPGEERLSCNFVETIAKPRRTRVFPAGTAFFVSRIKLTSRFGDDVCYWLMPREETERLLLGDGAEDSQAEKGPHPGLAALAHLVPVPLVVELGKAELSMSQVAELSLGDVLVLDQFVGRPLLASIEGQIKWAGAPLRIGSRQAFEITRLIEGGASTSSSTDGFPNVAHPDAPPELRPATSRRAGS